MELKGRLKLIADKVPECDIICDIGTDHGYIPIYLVENNICKRAVASDVRPGPVKAASGNISKLGLEKLIEARIGDGLQNIQGDEADVIVIAGMGSILISKILDRDFEKAKNARAIILQPMNAFEIIRKWLFDNGFEIYDEEMVSDTQKLYLVISARWTGCINKPEDIYYHIGKRLIEKKDPLLNKYLDRRIKQLDTIISDLNDGGCMDGEVRDNYIKLRKSMIEIRRG